MLILDKGRPKFPSTRRGTTNQTQTILITYIANTRAPRSWRCSTGRRCGRVVYRVTTLVRLTLQRHGHGACLSVSRRTSRATFRGSEAG